MKGPGIQQEGLTCGCGMPRQADEAYDQVERDRHYLQKQTVSHAGPDAELTAAQEHIRQLQRQLQLLERKCTGECPLRQIGQTTHPIGIHIL